MDCSLADFARCPDRRQHQPVATLAKLVPLGLFIVLAFIAFRLDVFSLDFSGIALGVPVWGAGEKHDADYPVGIYRR